MTALLLRMRRFCVVYVGFDCPSGIFEAVLESYRLKLGCSFRNYYFTPPYQSYDFERYKANGLNPSEEISLVEDLESSVLRNPPRLVQYLA